MKTLFHHSFLTFIVASILLAGCEQDRCTRTEEYIAYQPVYKRIDEMRKPASFGAPQPLTAPGKIFYYKGYLLINEMHKGIHVIDNANPSSPVNIGFIDVPG
ncbi:MAG: hypothetical protein ABIQ02_12185, partial [Saprospiraceae bacterium]